jgi:hypothetical protein
MVIQNKDITTQTELNLFDKEIQAKCLMAEIEIQNSVQISNKECQ